jgi:hypothetical protein
VSPADTPYKAIGVEGVRQSGGFVHDEFLQQLVGDRGRRTYREMRDNDSTISSILFAVEMLFRAVQWTVSVDEEGAEAEEAQEFVESVLFEDMSVTWDDFIGVVVTMLTYGWQYSEVTYKRRIGPAEKDPARRSKYTDGKIGIQRIADRSQETLYRWEISETGDVLGLWQMPPVGGQTVFIPIEKALLFRPHQHKGSPEGRSVLRGAYRSWYLLKRIQEVEAIAIERELNGLPVLYLPNATLNGTSAEARAAVVEYTKVVRDIKFNSQGGLLLPSDVFSGVDGQPSGAPQVRLELVSAQGTRAINTNDVVMRYQQDIARTILADFVMLGQGDRGSFALSRSKIDLFARALEGWLESIAQTINRHLIPKLWSLNGFDEKYMPYIVPGKIAPEDIKELGEYAESLSRAGIPIADEDTEDHLRRAAGLPEAPLDRDDYPNTIPEGGTSQPLDNQGDGTEDEELQNE